MNISTGISFGWASGFLMRQGHYSAVPETSKNFMTENEWGYWFEGKAATGDITSPFGDKLAVAGETRDGGSLRSHGRGEVLELCDDRKPVYGAQVERVYRGLNPH